ncbi:EAL domain-containing protein [Pseudomonas zeae]|uniref:EAL domain-containing protein n=1 Tax=Pseudomonas zeae TaxID=2745510 RepID=UPI0039E0C6B8
MKYKTPVAPRLAGGLRALISNACFWRPKSASLIASGTPHPPLPDFTAWNVLTHLRRRPFGGVVSSVGAHGMPPNSAAESVAPIPSESTMKTNPVPPFTHRALSILPIMWLHRTAIAVYYKYLFSASDFLKALHRKELAVHYQPIVDMHSGMWLGAEALLRWPSKGQEFHPEAIVSVLERAGLMPNVTRWICQRVIEDYSEILWACNDFYITINLSADDVMDPTFPDFIKQLLSEYKLPASRFAFEVTERVALDSEQAAIQLNRLRAIGHLIVLDDFGTGYSNLAYLDQLPVDIIKIDKSFTLRAESPSANIILSHVLNMARKLDIDVVVEGIETDHQAERISALGAQKAQGWLYSRELPPHELVRAYFSRPHPSMFNLV